MTLPYIYIAGLLLLFIANFRVWYRKGQLTKQQDIADNLKLKIERNKQVYAFRSRLLHEFGDFGIHNFMPDYDKMLASKKPLVASEWVDIDRLVAVPNIPRGYELGSEVDFRPYVPVKDFDINLN